MSYSHNSNKEINTEKEVIVLISKTEVGLCKNRDRLVEVVTESKRGLRYLDNNRRADVYFYSIIEIRQQMDGNDMF